MSRNGRQTERERELSAKLKVNAVEYVAGEAKDPYVVMHELAGLPSSEGCVSPPPPQPSRPAGNLHTFLCPCERPFSRHRAWWVRKKKVSSDQLSFRTIRIHGSGRRFEFILTRPFAEKVGCCCWSLRRPRYSTHTHTHTSTDS